MTKAKEAELAKRLDRLVDKGDAIIEALKALTQILVERQPMITDLVSGHPGFDSEPRMKALTERTSVAQASMGRELRVLGASKAARALGCSVWHASEVARGNRKSRRCEPVVKRMCKVVEVEA